MRPGWVGTWMDAMEKGLSSEFLRKFLLEGRKELEVRCKCMAGWLISTRQSPALQPIYE